MKISAVAICIVFLILSAGFRQSVLAQSAILTATIRPNPLEVKITAPSTVAVGQWFDVSADFSNLGSEVITKTIATLNTPSDLKVKGQRKKIGDLNNHETKTGIWQLKANASGDFVILVEVTGNLGSEQISATDSLITSAVGSLSHFLRRLIFGV